MNRLRAFNRGGNYNSSNSYSFPSFNGNNDRTNHNGNISFRAALPHLSDIANSRVCLQYAGLVKGFISSVVTGPKKVTAEITFSRKGSR